MTSDRCKSPGPGPWVASSADVLWDAGESCSICDTRPHILASSMASVPAALPAKATLSFLLCCTCYPPLSNSALVPKETSISKSFVIIILLLENVQHRITSLKS